jgi:hypothetical protein
MKCGKCGSSRIYPSRLRNIIERARQAVTGLQPYRCHNCDWRVWGEVQVHSSPTGETRPDDLRTGRDSAPVKPGELDELDTLGSRH